MIIQLLLLVTSEATTLVAPLCVGERTAEGRLLHGLARKSATPFVSFGIPHGILEHTHQALNLDFRRVQELTVHHNLPVAPHERITILSFLIVIDAETRESDAITAAFPLTGELL